MALRLRRLFAKGCLKENLSARSRIAVVMPQSRAVQNFPGSSFTCSAFGSEERCGKPIQLKIASSMGSIIGGNGHGITVRLPAQLRIETATRPRGSPGFGFFKAGNNFRLNSLSSELVGRRMYSSKSKKKFQFRVNLKEVRNNVVAGDGKTQVTNSLIEVFRGPLKQAKSLSAFNSLGAELKVADTDSSVKRTAAKTCQSIVRDSDVVKTEDSKVMVTDPTVKKGSTETSNSITTRTIDAIKNEEKISRGVREKQKATKSSGETQRAKGPAKKNQKKISKEQDELSGRSTSPSATEAKVTKATKTKKIGTTSASLGSVTGRQTSSIGGKQAGRREMGPLYPPSSKSVVIVESVTKAKIIQNYLGDMFEVLASYGHVRDLAGRSGSVRPDDDFSMVWEVPASAWTHLKSIRVALSGAENLILASDPDREGEAIAWHIFEMLQQQDALSENINVARVVFHEITETSIKNALQSPRDIDTNLVNAYLARRALDYLIGFSISPLLWRKLPGCQSAGRVQSATLALICDREVEIDQFKPKEYWTVGVEFRKTVSGSLHDGTVILSWLTHFNSKKLDQLSLCTQAEAEAIDKRVSSSKFKVLGSKTRKIQHNPPMPYITSTLQQDSANKLQFTAAYTMKVAQKLYEGVKLSDNEATGLITYMRTDGLHISDEAAKDIHSLVIERYGHKYAAKSIRKYFKKVKNAQEAHEAIRPTSIRRLPSTLVGSIDDDSLKLYTLIWSRTMACQMESASTDLVQVDFGNEDGDIILRSTGSKVGFPGFRAVYKDRETAINGNDDTQEGIHEETFKVLRTLKVNDPVQFVKVQLEQHYTKPTARYSEGSLIKKLEELGIGRPSTYASMIKVLQDRNYVTVKSRVLFPEFRGRMVSAFLSHHFSEVADYSFTADMENELDNVSAGITDWKGLLGDYWSRFSKYCQLAGNANIRQVEKMLEETLGHILFASIPDKSRTCPSCLEGLLVFKVSRFGAGYFIGCDQHPKCKYIAGTVFSEDDESVPSEKPDMCFQPKLIGFSPDSNEKIFLKNGPYGFYVQLGEDRKGCPPKRASIEVKDVESITIEDALELLRYPITLGNHPKDEHQVVLKHSKFGFSVKHRRTIASVPKNLDPKKITLEVGLKLLSSKNVKISGRPKSKPKPEETVYG